MKSALEELQAVIERLTDAENGCPWDKEQTPESLTEYLIEESHELVSAIRSGNTADVCEELGDVAFLLLFVAHLYQKRGQFSLDDALNNNRAKMVRRHPHVFGDVTFDNLDEQLKTWEKIKRAEHTDAEGKPQGLFDSLPSSLPPLTKAYRIHSKAARVGFTLPEDEEGRLRRGRRRSPEARTGRPDLQHHRDGPPQGHQGQRSSGPGHGPLPAPLCPHGRIGPAAGEGLPRPVAG